MTSGADIWMLRALTAQQQQQQATGHSAQHLASFVPACSLLDRSARIHGKRQYVLLCRGYVLFLTYKVVLMEHGGTEDVWKVRNSSNLLPGYNSFDGAVSSSSSQRSWSGRLLAVGPRLL